MYKIFVISVFVGIAIMTLYLYFGEKVSGHSRNVFIFAFALTFYCIFGGIYYDSTYRERYMPNIESAVEIKKAIPSQIPQITTVNGVILRKSIWVKNPADVDDLVDAVKRKDVSFLDRMIAERRAFFVFEDTRVFRSPSGLYDAVVFITFLEGQYMNQRGYTFLRCVPLEDYYFANKDEMYIPNSQQ